MLENPLFTILFYHFCMWKESAKMWIKNKLLCELPLDFQKGLLEVDIFFDILFNFHASVHDGRVVSLAEFFPNSDEWKVQRLATEVHRDMSRIGDVFRPTLRNQLLSGQSVVVRDDPFDFIRVQFVLIDVTASFKRP